VIINQTNKIYHEKFVLALFSFEKIKIKTVIIKKKVHQASVLSVNQIKMKIRTNQIENQTNLKFNQSVEYCSLSYITKVERLFECAYYYGLRRLSMSLSIILIVLLVFVFNLLAIYFLSIKNKIKSVFDKILISHAFMDLITGTVILPNYYLIAVFGYWPLNKSFCMFYVLIDNSMATLCTFHILYMSWVRINCIRIPKEYMKRFIAKNPFIVILLMTIVCLVFWAPASIVLVNNYYEDGLCFIEFKPQFLSLVIILLGWTVPVILIIIITIYILIILIQRKRSKRKKILSLTNKSENKLIIKSKNFSKKVLNKVNLNPQIKLSIIIAAFCIQYLPYSLVWIAVTFCSRCVSDTFFEVTYLMTFTASFTNPFILLVLNPRFFKSSK
jgi:hypothetical protein